MEWLFEFPDILSPNLTAIDNAVRAFAVWADPVLSAISGGIRGMVNGINFLLSHIPWFLLVLLVVLVSWKARKRLRTAILYGVLFSLVGAVGYWEMMLVTLSIVIASVIIALVLGLPIGVLLSSSDRANQIVRPVLDTMQTMPVFVYLIPALLLFGTGNAPAVMATVVYAVVPSIRLTSLGIRQVDKEVWRPPSPSAPPGVRPCSRSRSPRPSPPS